MSLYDDPLGRLPGTPLNPARHSVEDLQVRQAGSPRLFSSVWQQSPRSAEGTLINTSWFTVVAPHDLPDRKYIRSTCRAWDLSYTIKQVNKKNPDYSVGAKMSLWYYNAEEYFYILHNIIRFQANWPTTKKRIFDYGFLDGKQCHIVLEGGGPQEGLVEEVLGFKDAKKYRIKKEIPIKDKVARAQPWIDCAETNRFLVVQGDYTKDLFKEVEVFPNGIKDDQVDALSLGFYYLSKSIRRGGVTAVRMKGLYSGK